MSRKTTNSNIINVQFVVKKGDLYFDVFEKIFEKYPGNVKATSIKNALKDLLNIFETTDSANSTELIKKFIVDPSINKSQ